MPPRWTPSALLPPVQDVVFLSTLIAVVRGGSIMLSLDGDPARHLTVGSYILASGRILDSDPFSHTMAGQPYAPHEWLAEVAAAVTYNWAGPAGPVLLSGAVIGLTFALLFTHLRSRGHAP